MVPLVDMLKETVQRTGWLDAISSVATGGSIRPDVLAERLLLAIYAYSQVAFEVAVGTALRTLASGCPPRRSQRARLTHWAPGLGFSGEAHVGPGMLDAIGR